MPRGTGVEGGRLVRGPRQPFFHGLIFRGRNRGQRQRRGEHRRSGRSRGMVEVRVGSRSGSRLGSAVTVGWSVVSWWVARSRSKAGWVGECEVKNRACPPAAVCGTILAKFFATESSASHFSASFTCQGGVSFPALPTHLWPTPEVKLVSGFPSPLSVPLRPDGEGVTAPAGQVLAGSV